MMLSRRWLLIPKQQTPTSSTAAYPLRSIQKMALHPAIAEINLQIATTPWEFAFLPFSQEIGEADRLRNVKKLGHWALQRMLNNIIPPVSVACLQVKIPGNTERLAHGAFLRYVCHLQATTCHWMSDSPSPSSNGAQLHWNCLLRCKGWPHEFSWGSPLVNL